jgi:polyisoprenoid-binding protein YceI
MNIQTGTWILDPAHTAITFTVKHLMISKVKGSFGSFHGQATVAEDIKDSTLNVTIEANSITTGEPNRDAHLKTNDFFGTEENPEILFTSTSVEAKSEDKLLIHGNLTINSITKPVTFTAEFGGVATDGYGQTKAALEASATINRTDFGITWNSKLETGGVLVSEDVKIEIDAQASFQQ